MATLLHITTHATISPVESGKRATARGYFPYIGEMILEGEFKIFRNGGKPLYSGIFFEDGTHMTYNFNPKGPKLPEGVQEGDKASVRVLGSYEDAEVGCLVVEYNGLTHQP
jgi:hypothetical protein